MVDEKALVQALQEGKIAGAGLDVYEREPEVEPLLVEMKNVVLTPRSLWTFGQMVDRSGF